MQSQFYPPIGQCQQTTEWRGPRQPKLARIAQDIAMKSSGKTSMDSVTVDDLNYIIAYLQKVRDSKIDPNTISRVHRPADPTGFSALDEAAIASREAALARQRAEVEDIRIPMSTRMGRKGQVLENDRHDAWLAKNGEEFDATRWPVIPQANARGPLGVLTHSSQPLQGPLGVSQHSSQPLQGPQMDRLIQDAAIFRGPPTGVMPDPTISRTGSYRNPYLEEGGRERSAIEPRSMYPSSSGRDLSTESRLRYAPMTRKAGQSRVQNIDRFEDLPFNPQDPRYFEWESQMDTPRGCQLSRDPELRRRRV